jgi:hypothetical protein
MPFFYFAYGMVISSELELPELVPAIEGPADLTIRIGEIDWSPSESPRAGNCVVKVNVGEIHFCWPGVGKFLARGGYEIVLEPLEGVEECVLRLFLLGAVLAGALHQQGLLLLHASAVRIGDNSVVFMGEKGHGKSTLAAALQICPNNNYDLLADDIVALKVTGKSTSFVIPGFPQLKLWPDAIASFGIQSEELSVLHPELSKRAYSSVSSFTIHPVVLKTIYVLAWGERASIEPLSRREAFIELARYSYLGHHVRATGFAVRQFDKCTLVANSVPIARLVRPPSIDLLPIVAKLVVDDMAGNTVLESNPPDKINSLMKSKGLAFIPADLLSGA